MPFFRFPPIDILPAADQRTARLHATLHQLDASHIDATEAACLKALILYRPDCAGLQSAADVAVLQAQTVSLLLEKCGGARMGHLLLMLPCIKIAADRRMMQELLFRKTVGEVAIERLLGDLIRN